jgi:hypothetical protein
VFVRVTKARLDVLRRIFADAGLPAADVDDRAWLAYAFYVGHHQLGRAAETRALRPARLDRLVELLMSPSTPKGARPRKRPGPPGGDG